MRRAVTVIILAIPVIHPLPHVPQDIVQPESVGTLLADFMRLLAALAGIPGNLIDGAVSRPGAPGAGGVFPLRLRGQSAACLGAERRRIIPGLKDRHVLICPARIEAARQRTVIHSGHGRGARAAVRGRSAKCPAR